MVQERPDALQRSDRFFLLGANSRIAGALRRRLAGHAQVFGIARDPAAEIPVADYAEVPAQADLRGGVIVNCVGTDRGPADLLNAVNCDVPAAWARAAERQGAAGFVQISSFSIFAAGPAAGPSVRLDPATDYGRSKLAAETALQALLPPDRLRIVRTPILIAEAGAAPPDKLAQLMAALRRFCVVPRLAQDVQRSMLSYDGLAAAIIKSLGQPDTLVHAADPAPFGYGRVRAIAAAEGVRLRPVPIPRSAALIAQRAAPALFNRLFSSMQLDPAANVLSADDRFLTLDAIIGSHFRGRSGAHQGE